MGREHSPSGPPDAHYATIWTTFRSPFSPSLLTGSYDRMTPMPATATQPFRFRLMAAGFAAAALYHLTALTIPAFARVSYSPTYPVWRHLTFILVDGSAAYFMLRRLPWFIWAYLVLTIQVLQGHGLRLWQVWFGQHRIQWIDLITVLGTLLGLLFLYWDRPTSVTPATPSSSAPSIP